MESVYLDADQILFQKIREEDEESFNLLYKKYWAEVYNNALKLLHDHEQAQDVTQGIFIDLWLKKKDLKINNFKAYLYVTVRNRVLRIFGKKRCFMPFEDLISINPNIANDESADFLTLKHEFLQAYGDLLNLLPSQQKKIFDYYFNDGLSTIEIANQLSLSRKTVQNHLSRAISFLKTNLSQLQAILLVFFF